jgi:putative PIN family toxin of toxin-antitoxin system
VPPVVVFDTNILFSAIGWRGRAYECIEQARLGTAQSITCQEILDELADKLRMKLAFSDDQIPDTLADLLSFTRLVSITNTLTVITDDPDDDKVLECAVLGMATHIVTGDRRHLLPLGAYHGISIISAADFLAVVVPPP